MPLSSWYPSAVLVLQLVLPRGTREFGLTEAVEPGDLPLPPFGDFRWTREPDPCGLLKRAASISTQVPAGKRASASWRPGQARRRCALRAYRFLVRLLATFWGRPT